MRALAPATFITDAVRSLENFPLRDAFMRRSNAGSELAKVCWSRAAPVMETALRLLDIAHDLEEALDRLETIEGLDRPIQVEADVLVDDHVAKAR